MKYVITVDGVPVFVFTNFDDAKREVDYRTHAELYKVPYYDEVPDEPYEHTDQQEQEDFAMDDRFDVYDREE